MTVFDWSVAGILVVTALGLRLAAPVSFAANVTGMCVSAAGLAWCVWMLAKSGSFGV